MLMTATKGSKLLRAAAVAFSLFALGVHGWMTSSAFWSQRRVQHDRLFLHSAVSSSQQDARSNITSSSGSSALSSSLLSPTTKPTRSEWLDESCNKESDSEADDDYDDEIVWSKTDADDEKKEKFKLQGRLLKDMRRTCLDYKMLQEGDHIMVCVSGGKDSATLLTLLRLLQQQLPIHFDLTAVHVNQKQPGYNGTALVHWLEHDMKVPYVVIEEDTYNVVVDKTQEGKSYCTLCSRLRRGILYSKALELGCNKICLGHHADDCLETLLLNMIHAGQIKAMPARYTSVRRRRRPLHMESESSKQESSRKAHNQEEDEEVKLAVMRPLIACSESDIAQYAKLSNFPILPCNLCGNQENLQRPQVKMLLQALQRLNPQAQRSMLRACQNVRPRHLLDQDLRAACGMDPITGEEEEEQDDDLPL